jgi:protein TonB
VSTRHDDDDDDDRDDDDRDGPDDDDREDDERDDDDIDDRDDERDGDDRDDEIDDIDDIDDERNDLSDRGTGGRGPGASAGEWRPVALASLAVLLVIGTGVFLVIRYVHGIEPRPQLRIQEVTVVRPPPPPPPPIEEPLPPPEPEMVQPEFEPEEVAAPEPEPAEAPPAASLGLDAEGGVGGDGFGLVGRKGGRGLVGGTGTGGTLAGWYTGVLQRDLQAFLENQEGLRSKHYSVVVRLWLAADGRVERSVLDTSSGDPSIDASIEEALNSGFQVSERPPKAKFKAVKIRLTSRS